MAENVRVVVRCRPMNRRETEMNCKNVISIENSAVSLENPVDSNAPTKDFTYDCAYDAKAPTEAIYNDICYSLVESVLEGYNGTIFAYGQTGCGKSHTMQGPEEALLKHNNEKMLAQRGIISRSFDHIFEAISVASGVRYLALVSYLEIYNETIRDLLGNVTTADQSCAKLQLKEIPGEGVVVQNLSTHTVHNVQECEQLLMMGAKNRIVGATLMNAESSRSHSIFTISLEQISTESGDSAPSIRKGKLNLVDLAGSERQAKTGATGDRLKEATKINLSLSALGNVISALVDGKTKHIPYRDSKLTRLLQDSLGGNTKTLMVACISPAEYNYEETLSTLRYASRAKNINNKPRINEDPKDTMLREYQEEIVKLKNLLNSQMHGQPIISEIDMEVEKSNLRNEYEAEVKRLKLEHEIQRKEKEELTQNMEKLKHEYENRLTKLSTPSIIQNTSTAPPTTPKIDSEGVVERLQMIKNALIGGERSNDLQLKEKRNKKKYEAQKKLTEIASALNRVEVSEDRDILQRHYSSIQQELQVKSDEIKKHRNKIRSLEQEITDLQSEFQLDRADYLETIRKLERNLKFYQQLFDKALPCLRKDGRFWDIDIIRAEASWNDDLKKWKFQEDALSRVKLPPALPTTINTIDTSSSRLLSGRRESTSLTAPGRLESEDNPPEIKTTYSRQPSIDCEENDFLMKKLKNSESTAIIDSYFRPRRVNELLQQTRGFGSWKAPSDRNYKNPYNTSWANQTTLSKTWSGLSLSDTNNNSTKDFWGITTSRPSYQLSIGQLGPNTQYSQ